MSDIFLELFFYSEKMIKILNPAMILTADIRGPNWVLFVVFLGLNNYFSCFFDC